jgi:hypothetical protein
MDSARAVTFGKFILAAYDMSEPGGDDPLRPPASSTFPDGYDLHGWITMSDFLLTLAEPVFYGFVAIARELPFRAVVAIRGTDSWLEVFDDAQAGFMTGEAATGYKAGDVDAGFGRIYQTLTVTPADPTIAATTPEGATFAAQIAHLVRSVATKRLVQEVPSIVITGHSLGAALVTLYVVQNAHTQPEWKPEVFTFASPRVGDATFVAAYEAGGATTYRIVNRPDVVPQLPWEIWGYLHVENADPVLIDSTGSVRSSLSCAHALNTYLHVLVTEVALDPECKPDERDAHLGAKQTL